MNRRSGALLVMLVLLAALLVVPGASGFGAAGGSADIAGPGTRAVPEGPVVLVGTTGVRWRDLTSASGGGASGGAGPASGAGEADTAAAPAMAELLDAQRPAGHVPADAVALALTTGAAARCPAGGWLALSAGGLAESSESPHAACAAPAAEPLDGEPAATEQAGGAAVVAGWARWRELQRGSAYGARLGGLGKALDGVCATAVGPGAAIALARPDGSVGRYTDEVSPAAFACPVTVVDAGNALLTAAETEREDAEALRRTRVAAVDARVAEVLAAVPEDATVVLADLANQVEQQPELGVGMVMRPVSSGADGSYATARYLSSSATRTTGVARAADLPATLLEAAGREAGGLGTTPLVRGENRPTAGVETADALADVTDRDHRRRAAYTVLVEGGFWAALALAGVCWWAGRRARDRTRPVPGRWRRAAVGASLFLGALPVAGFLASLTGWWRFPAPGLALGAAITAIAALVAGVVAAVPRRSAWVAPGLLAAVTFAVLTVDGLLDTPLNRAAPLGAAPSYGARFYGFGNPTFCVYAVAAVVCAAALAQWLASRGRRRLAASAVVGIGLVALVVDVLPGFGADLGGGPALVPAFAVLAFAAYGGRLRAGRIVAVTGAGVVLVAAVGVADWLRPAAERSHLGRFVADVVDGEAWAILARKAAYAARSMLAGPSVWVTVLVLVAVAVVIFTPVLGRRLEPPWSHDVRTAWPLFRPTVAAIWLTAVTGSLVNDFGLRIAMICVLAAVPLLTLAVLRSDGVRHGET